jgi:hypothetical protein
MEMADEKFYQQILDIISSENKYNVSREVIFQIEDTGFTVEQSAIVSPWLLDFALENRDDPDTISSAYSAIRTGASMLLPESVECLLPLLKDDGDFSVSMVTVKMIGRIFEAFPPSKIGQYEHMSEEVFGIVDSMLDGSKLASGCPGAKAELCVTTLAAMGSESVFQILEKVKKQEQWFIQYVFHNMEELRDTWQNRKDPVSSPMNEFINEIINFLRKNSND